jgi:hypothetical protein
MVEFHLKPGSKREVMDLFELRGPNRNPGVKYRGAWLGTRSDIIFVVGEADSDALVERVAQSWSAHGTFTIHPVIDFEEY